MLSLKRTSLIELTVLYAIEVALLTTDVDDFIFQFLRNYS